MSLEDYIKDLDPELQEKARACGSVDELLALAKDARFPVSDEMLEAIAGGGGLDSESCDYGPQTCPNCGSTNIKLLAVHQDGSRYIYDYMCLDCKHWWELWT